jgi:hypothetical protein
MNGLNQSTDPTA